MNNRNINIRIWIFIIQIICIVNQSYATQKPRNLQVEVLDSFKSLYNKSESIEDKARYALEITGFLAYNRLEGENADLWLERSTRYIRKISNPGYKGYWYTFKSYLLSTDQREIKYKYLDSADMIFPVTDLDGRNYLQYIRIRYDIAYERYAEAEKNLEILKKNLETQNARPILWGSYYYQEMAQLGWSRKNYKEAAGFFTAQLSCITMDESFDSKLTLVHIGLGFFVNNPTSYARTCNNIGISYVKLDSIIKAVSYYKKSIEYFQKQQDHPGLAWTYQLIGECFVDIGMPNDAESWFQRSIRELEYYPRNFVHDYFQCVTYLNEVYPQLNHFDQWIATLDSAYNYFNEINNVSGKHYYLLGALLLDKANACASAGNLVEAKAELRKAEPFVHMDAGALPHTSEIENRIQSNLIHESIIKAWIAAKENNPVKYAEYRDKALSGIDEMKDISMQMPVYYEAAWYMINVHDYTHIIQRHSNFLRKLNTRADILQRRNLSGELADAFAYLKQYDSAYKYKSIYAAMNDSIYNFQRIYAIADLSEKYQAENETMALARKNEILSKQHAQNVILLLSGIFILSLISAVLFLNRQRLANLRKIEIIEKEKIKLEMISQQKELSETALELMRSNNAYGGLLHEVEEIGKSVKGDNRKHFRKLIIGHKMQSQEDTWRQFNAQFEKMNSGFYDSLNDLEPGLTESEKKICALMALGLSNKEICAVTFQPIRSIYTYKNRLRKRFSYSSDEELSEMLSKLLKS